jgi:hypothetical protein
MSRRIRRSRTNVAADSGCRSRSIPRRWTWGSAYKCRIINQIT